MRAINDVSFPQMTGVWAMCLWEQMGQPDKVNLIELGPGRGTLLADLLRVMHFCLHLSYFELSLFVSLTDASIGTGVIKIC